MNGLSYAVQAGIAFYFSQRFYAVSYEAVRLGQVALAGSIAFVLNTLMERPVQSLAGVGLLVLGLPAYWYWKR